MQALQPGAEAGKVCEPQAKPACVFMQINKLQDKAGPGIHAWARANADQKREAL
jgi:hypothetical protein